MKEPSRAPAYACIYHGLAIMARRYGYALAIHGTMASDLDLIAVPWTEDAADPETVVEAITKHVNACAVSLDQDGNEQKEPTKKPHGRLAWRLHMWAGGTVDLSVMPRSE